MVLQIIYIVVSLLITFIVVVLILASLKPDTFEVQRSAVIKAAPEKIFPMLNDFRNWMHWSPWEKIDPNLKRTYSGPPSGQGTIYEWEGNKNVGSGRMEVAESSAPSKVKIKLDFLKPFKASNIAEFALHPQGNSTEVNWRMYGRQPFMGKVMCLFMSMDKMVGKDFEKGLANLKAATETAPS